MKYFETDGFRGRANERLTVNHAFKIGRFLGWYFSQESGNEEVNIVIGKDTRRSSYMFESALSAGITSSGANAYLMHVTPTPSVAYITRTESFNCGVMISASHNPYYDNGIKLINKNGYKMEDDILKELEDYLDSDDDYIPLAKDKEIGRTVDHILGRNRYIAYLTTVVQRSFKGYKVLLDMSNGAAFTIANNVFNILGADIEVVNDKPDGYNINENSGSTHINLLVDKMKTGDYDVAFAYDGDADRCLAIDEKGNIVDGDGIIYSLGKSLKERNQLYKDTVVTTVMSNYGLYKALDKEDINYIVTDVGDKYVSEEMCKNGYTIGGEQSGHIILSKYATGGDGILTSLKLMELIIESKMSLSLLTQDFIKYPQKLVNIEVKDKNKVVEDQDILSRVNYISKELEGEGRILFRKSGTEPLVRIMVEAESYGLCDKYCQEIEDLIRHKNYII